MIEMFIGDKRIAGLSGVLAALTRSAGPLEHFYRALAPD